MNQKKSTNIFRFLFNLLSKKERQLTLKTFFLIVINSFVDIFSISILIPLLYTVNKTTISEKTISGILHFFSFKTFESFQLFLIVFLILTYILKVSLNIFTNYKVNQFSFQISANISKRNYTKELNSKFESFSSKNSNDIVRNVIVIPHEFANLVLIPALQFLNELIVTSIIILGILIYNPIVFLICLAALIPGVLTIVFYINKKTKAEGIKKDNFSVTHYKYIYMSIFNFMEIKLNNLNEFFINKVDYLINRFFKTLNKLMVFESLPYKIIEFSSILIISSILFFYCFILDMQADVFNILIIYAAAAFRLLPSVNRILSAVVKIKGAMYIKNKFESNNYIKEENNLNEPEVLVKNNKINTFKDVISVENVYFSYGKDQILRNVSFKIKKLDLIKFTGPSGSGKTTLINIIAQIISNYKGSILVDGKLINQKNSKSWQKLISYVPQNFYIRDGTIKENVAFGIEEERINNNLVIDCLLKAELMEKVNKFGDGIDEKINEEGRNLSGGQRQRLAIARALYKQPEILIFDEATSALDNKTEESIFKTLKKLNKSGMTILIITHKKNHNFEYTREVNL